MFVACVEGMGIIFQINFVNSGFYCLCSFFKN